MPLTNMKSTKGDTLLGGEVATDKPEFPFGLTIHLDRESLEKLGIDKLPSVGTMMNLVAVVKVKDINEYEDDKQVSRSMGLQITDMNLSGGKEDRTAEEKLFGPARPEPRGPQITDIGDF